MLAKVKYQVATYSGEALEAGLVETCEMFKK
jgi:hypothetical protein